MPNGNQLAEQLKWLQHPAFGAVVSLPAKGTTPGGDGRTGARSASQPAAPVTPLGLHMRFSIGASVGKGGKNKPEDVQAVQAALNGMAKAGLTANGKIDDKTIAAIVSFQKTLGGFKPDGLVEPGRRTAEALESPSKAPPHSSVPADAPLRQSPPNLQLPSDYEPKAPGPPKKDDKSAGVQPEPEEPAVETSGVGSSSTDGPDMQAKITFHSKARGKLGETEFTVHVGPGSRLSQLELDLTALKIGLNTLNIESSVLDLEATLSLNATADNKALKLDPQTTRVIFDAVEVQAKAEIEAHFKSKKVPGLKKVAFKLTATYGTGGPGLTGSIEIPIPWGD